MTYRPKLDPKVDLAVRITPRLTPWAHRPLPRPRSWRAPFCGTVTYDRAPEESPLSAMRSR